MASCTCLQETVVILSFLKQPVTFLDMGETAETRGRGGGQITPNKEKPSLLQDAAPASPTITQSHEALVLSGHVRRLWVILTCLPFTTS